MIIKDSAVAKAVHEDLRPKALKTGKFGAVLESLISGKESEHVRGAVDLCRKVCARRMFVVSLRLRFIDAKKARWRVGLKGYWRVDD